MMDPIASSATMARHQAIPLAFVLLVALLLQPACLPSPATTLPTCTP